MAVAGGRRPFRDGIAVVYQAATRRAFDEFCAGALAASGGRLIPRKGFVYDL